MGYITAILVLIVPIIISVAFYHVITQIPPTPTLENTWWGAGDPAKEDTSIKPFKIAFSDEMIKDLQQRFASARPFTPPLEGAKQNYGMNTQLLTKIVDHWRTKYDFKEREKFLNQFPQYTVSVQGLRIHYIHVKPTNPNNLKVVPLLLLHGWPGSVREFYEMIPLLTKPQSGRNFVFEVLAPSLPGYGFSEGAVRPGLGAAQVAVVFKNFMERLNFKNYYIQGGDWGAIIVQHMATLFPDKVAGVHSNMCVVNTPLSNLKTFVASFWPSLLVDKEMEKKVYPLSEKFAHLLTESGYMHLQSTKPDTVGVALNDSPVGLAAYIIEKFTTWTNPEWRNLDDGGLTKKFTYTNLLDNVMIYWSSKSITTSVRLYAETMNKAQFGLQMEKIPVVIPSACARFSHEIMHQAPALLQEKYHNLVHESSYKDGGHFAAFELPDVLARDIYTAVDKMMKYKPSNK